MSLLFARGLNAANSRLSSGYGPNYLSGDSSTFEGGTTGNWAAGASNAIASSAAQARTGSRSGLCTFTLGANMANLSGVNLPSAGAWEVEMYVLIPSGWDGGNVKATFDQYAGSAEVLLGVTAVTGAWTRIYQRATIAAGDKNGVIRLEVTSAPSASKFFYIDDVQIRTVL